VEGKFIGFCRSVEGGGLKAEMLKYELAGTQKRLDTWKWSGRPKFDDITVSVGMGMSPTFWDWIGEFFKCEGKRHNGSIQGADFGYNVKVRRDFKQAMISEVQLPAVDGSSKDACYMQVKLTPEDMEYTKGGGKLKGGPGVRQPSKRWLAANFRFSFDTLPASAFERVTKVDGFTIKQQILDYASGNTRFPIRVPGRIEFPNITFYVPQNDVAPFEAEVKKRFKQHVAKNGAGFTGSLTYLASDNTTELLTVGMHGIDILSVEPEKFESTSDNVHRMKVTIHVEWMTFKYNTSVATANPL
jgi:hypothetical protein